VDVKTWEKEFYEIPDSLSFTALLDDRGRVTIPVSVRKKLKIKPFSVVPVTVKSLKIKTDK
jgi:bifunctional DNA-binding transcriptional regulator/antitoxin component of YhaV-PrlF toxin-antitoxin module